MPVFSLGLASLSVGGSIAITNNTITLVNDVVSPGNNYFYGTSGSGTKGWFTISAGGALLATNNLSDLASIPTGRSNLQVVYPTANLAVSGNIAVWANSMGITGTSGDGIPWPSWIGIRAGRTMYNGSVPGETSTQIKARFDAAPEKRGYYTIFDVARNDVDFTVTKANIAAMIATLTTDRYLVIGVLCRQSSPVGNAQHTLDIAFNAEMAALYGDRFFDPQTYMVGMWDPNSAQDVTDHTNEVFPTSLTDDGTHYNNAGHIAFADRVTPIVLHSLNGSTGAFVGDISITKSAPTLTLNNTGAGAGSFATAVTTAAGQYRITEVGVADRFVISKTTGYVGIGTTSPLNPFVVSNGGAAGMEFAPATGGVLFYNRVSSAYAPATVAASTFSFTIGATQKFGIDASGNAVFVGTLAATSAGFSGDITVTKSAPTLNLANTGAGGKTFSIETTAVAGDFRITEVGVADRMTILPTSGYVGFGTTLPITPFVISNGAALGLEIDPSSAGGTQVGIACFNRALSAYKPLVFSSSYTTFQTGVVGYGVTSTATASGTTTLTSSSNPVQIFTGSLAQTVQLPAANTLSAGISVIYTLINRSGVSITVLRAGGDTIEGSSSYSIGANSSISLYSNSVSAWFIA